VLEWQAVLAAGAVGGFASTFLRTGADVPSPELIEDFLQHHKGAALVYHLARNTVFGALASLVLWGLYSPSANLESGQVAVHQLGASFVAGGGGVAVISNPLKQQQLQRANRALANATLQLTEAIEEEGEDRDGQ
jgi:hypothetical protein